MPADSRGTMSWPLTASGCKAATGTHAALALAGAGYHIAAALTIPENVTLVRLPPYAPELNPIENVWEYLRGNKPSPSSTTTTTSLIKPATHGTSLNKIQIASRQSQLGHGQQSITRAVGIIRLRACLLGRCLLKTVVCCVRMSNHVPCRRVALLTPRAARRGAGADV